MDCIINILHIVIGTFNLHLFIDIIKNLPGSTPNKSYFNGAIKYAYKNIYKISRLGNIFGFGLVAV